MRTPRDTPRPDRRIDRTRKLLADALVELILEKGYETVSVQDILDRANVGRSTFYAHFENKEELLFNGHSWLNNAFFTEPEQPETFFGIDLMGLFQHAADNRRLARAMLGKNSSELIIGHIRDVLYLRIRKTLKAEPQPGSETEVELTAQALAALLVGVLRAWLETDLPATPEQLVQLTRSLVREQG